MSYHAKTPSEVRTYLASRYRRTVISSLLITLVIILVLVIALFLFKIMEERKEHAELVVTLKNQNLEEIPTKTKVSIHRKPTSPSSKASRVLVTSTPSSVTVPQVDWQIDEISGENVLGEDWGLGSEDNGYFGNLPQGMTGRCSARNRLARLRERGGTPEVEDAVMQGLHWLKKSQNSHGSWGEKNQVAMTGLALLAFLGHCETPLSEEFGDTILKATLYLCNVSMANEGRLAEDLKTNWAYEHAIATYALCESQTFSDTFGYHVPGLSGATLKAVQWIIDKQNPAGGWNYTYSNTKRLDTSIGAWHLQALFAAQKTGIDFVNIETAIHEALTGITVGQLESGAFRYCLPQMGRSNYISYRSLTGAGTLCVQQHLGYGHPRAQDGVKYLGLKSKFNYQTGASFYDHYYVSQVMMNEGGQYWNGYNLMFRDQLLHQQSDDGSWPSPANDPFSTGLVSDTCFAILMLEVYYRFLPTSSETGL